MLRSGSEQGIACTSCSSNAGHQWLAEHLGVRPDHGFSIDPFGHSSTMPYLLKNLDLKTIFIQRIHYNLRKFLAQNNATEFSWEQPWDQSEAASIFTHLAPHHLYTIKNICSLSPINCYLFDFKDAIQPWDKKQVMENAPALLEQFRKTASIYPHNVVLYILGDDFRWAEEHEWQNQYNSYSALIKVCPSSSVCLPVFPLTCFPPSQLSEHSDLPTAFYALTLRRCLRLLGRFLFFSAFDRT